ncbi:hypothetical protein CTI14_64150, partial [Methylobacterium radiotolerans]
ETFFDGVRKLLPGEMMTVDLATSRFRISSYTRHGARRGPANERILYRYLQYRIHDDTEETFFDGVRKLLPGEMMTVDLATSRFRISSYTR